MKKIKPYIRRKLIRFLANFYGEIKLVYLQNEWKKTALQFKQIGQNCNIQYPYTFTNANLISIGENFYSGHNLRLDAISNYGHQTFKPEIIIGNNVSFQSNCHLGAISKITIEDNVMMASNIFISDHFHGIISNIDVDLPPAQRELSTKGEIKICNSVWIGDSVCILPGVCIEKNTIVGANSVVTKSFPANVVIAGVPAKIIKTLV